MCLPESKGHLEEPRPTAAYSVCMHMRCVYETCMHAVCVSDACMLCVVRVCVCVWWESGHALAHSDSLWVFSRRLYVLFFSQGFLPPWYHTIRDPAHNYHEDTCCTFSMLAVIPLLYMKPSFATVKFCHAPLISWMYSFVLFSNEMTK